MARIRATCSSCQKTILLYFDENRDDDWPEIARLKKGELFEHKCPNCGEWGAFEVAE